MSRELMKEAAKAAGITEKQAETFMRGVFHPTERMVSIGREYDTIGLWDNPPADLVGLTRMEWDEAKCARIWRAMCAALLSYGDGNFFISYSSSALCPNPKSDFAEDAFNEIIDDNK